MQPDPEHVKEAQAFELELRLRALERQHEEFFAERDRDEELREWREQQAELVVI